jgi:hypothetical protein
MLKQSRPDGLPANGCAMMVMARHVVLFHDIGFYHKNRMTTNGLPASHLLSNPCLLERSEILSRSKKIWQFFPLHSIDIIHQFYMEKINPQSLPFLKYIYSHSIDTNHWRNIDAPQAKHSI